MKRRLIGAYNDTGLVSFTAIMDDSQRELINITLRHIRKARLDELLRALAPDGALVYALGWSEQDNLPPLVKETISFLQTVFQGWQANYPANAGLELSLGLQGALVWLLARLQEAGLDDVNIVHLHHFLSTLSNMDELKDTHPHFAQRYFIRSLQQALKQRPQAQVFSTAIASLPHDGPLIRLIMNGV